MSENIRKGTRNLLFVENPRADRVVDIVIDIGDAIGKLDDAPFERGGLSCARVVHDPVFDFLGEVHPVEIAVRFQEFDHGEGLLIMAKTLRRNAVENLFADVSERRVSEIVTECDRLDEVFVETQGSADRPCDLCDFERMRQARAIVIFARRNVDLRLSLRKALECRILSRSLSNTVRISQGSSASSLPAESTAQKA